VPKPMTARVGGQPLRDVELLDWCRDFVEAVLVPTPVAAEGPR
jgi:transcription-repair coupling factor (superfamily II helicase)